MTNKINDGIIEKLISVNRVSKVVKGGRIFSFSALVVIGDQNGKAGFGLGKSNEVPTAIQKATEVAKRSLIRVPLKGTTLYHEVISSFGATKVIMNPASEGTGVIAGGPMRAIFEVLGIENILAKSIGSRTAINVVRATFKALESICSPGYIAEKRGKTIKQL